MKLRVLVTNDDGIDSPGLHALAAVACALGHDVVVAAPLTEASGSSCAIMATEEHGRVIVQAQPVPGLPGVRGYGVAASPAFIVLIATRGAFGPPPQLVLSGINRGANVGRSVVHSGTVGAALTAGTYGCRALAVSLDVGLNGDAGAHWTTAAQIATDLLPTALAAPEGVAINLNVPDLSTDDMRGVRRATLAPFGIVQTNVTEVDQGYVNVTIADMDRELVPGTDAAWLADGYASVTALHPVGEAADFAFPDGE